MGVATNVDGLKRAGEHRRRLASVVRLVLAVSDDLGAASSVTLGNAGVRVGTDAFRIMVVGEFKRGKSTLVNAMLGQKILPAYSRPATAVVTELSWSAEPCATLHPVKESEQAITVHVDQLEQHITIPRGVAQGSAETSPWARAEVGWPLGLLKDGVVLVDSPGLNEHPARQQATLDNLGKADAIVFVQDAQHAVSIAEAQFMTTFLDPYDIVFFVFNKINLIPDDEADDTKQDILVRLRRYRDATGIRRDKHFFVNALQALQSRGAGDDAGWTSSGVADFSAQLTHYLADDRHRAKILGPARETEREIKAIRIAIRDERRLLDTNVADLQAAYANAQAPLARLEAKAQQIRAELELRIRDIHDRVREAVLAQLIKLADEMPEVVSKIVTESKVSLRPWKIKEAAEQYAEEVSQKASAELQARFAAWQKEELNKLIGRHLTALAERADVLVREFREELARVRSSLLGADLGDIGDWEVDGAALGEPATVEGLSGASLRHLLQQVAALYGVLVVWAFTPFGFIPLIIGALGAGAVVWAKANDKLTNKVRSEISKVMAQHLRETAAENANKAANEIRSQLMVEVDGLMARVDGALRQLRQQVEAALTRLAAGTDQVETRKADLAGHEQTLDTAADDIDDLISEVALL